jgi:hypothetical protein
MANFFKNAVIKNVGKEPILALETDGSTKTTVLGISFTNLTSSNVFCNVLLHDDTSVEGYYIKDTLLPPNTSLRAMLGGEKLIIAPNNQLYVSTDTDDSVDAVISYVEIV